MLRPPHHDDPQRGQALVEFALTLPILLMLVFGIIDLARIMFAYTQVVDASRQASRYGIVEGLPATRDQYFNCDAIRDRALQLSGVITLQSSATITYKWTKEDDTTGTKVCNPDNTGTWPTWATFEYADGTKPQVVMEVNVTGRVQPITPVIMPFVGTFNVNYTSTRTIVFKGASYTEVWEKAPPKPLNFAALVDCGTGNVDFYWSPIVTDPPNNLSRLEIHRANLLDHPVVANPSPAYAYCTHAMGCSTVTIPTSGSSANGAYYLQAFVGHPPMEQSSAPSDTAAVVCPTAGGTNGAIWGTVWNDVDGNGQTNETAGIPGVTVWLSYWGPDGIYGNADDNPSKLPATTAADGSFTFGSLVIGRPYVIEVNVASAPLAAFPDGTTDNPRVVAVPSSAPVTSINFGYWNAP